MSQASWRDGLHACALIGRLESSTNDRFAKPVGNTHSTAGEVGKPTYPRKKKKEKEKGFWLTGDVDYTKGWRAGKRRVGGKVVVVWCNGM